MSKAITWGVLGCAGIARRAFLPALAHTSDQLGAIASRDLAKAQSWATEFGARRAYGSYDELLADEAVDAVYVPLPNSEHAAWVKKAAEHGKHVFCEKPLATSAAEAEAMVAACKAAGVYLFEAFVYQCHPQNLELRRRLRDGQIGEVRGAFAQFSFHLQERAGNIRMDPNLAGGALMDVGCYGVSYARYVMESEPTDVAATARFDPDYGVDMSVGAVLDFPGGIATVSASMEMQGGQMATIHGTEGMVHVEAPYHPGKSARVVIRGKSAAELDFGSEYPPFFYAIEHFSRVVRGETEPLVQPEEAIANARALDAVAQSIRVQERVAVVRDGGAVG